MLLCFYGKKIIIGVLSEKVKVIFDKLIVACGIFGIKSACEHIDVMLGVSLHKKLYFGQKHT